MKNLKMMICASVLVSLFGCARNETPEEYKKDIEQLRGEVKSLRSEIEQLRKDRASVRHYPSDGNPASRRAQSAEARNARIEQLRKEREARREEMRARHKARMAERRNQGIGKPVQAPGVKTTSNESQSN